MQTTPNLGLKKPESNEYVNVTDINDNSDLIDTAVAERVESSGGDISETLIETLEPIDTKYPVPAAGETTKVFMGKVKKYIEDTKPLDADMTVYVATTGSDTTGDGTSSNPYETITYALSTIPKVLNGNLVTINLADGVYDEHVFVYGFTSGALKIQSTTPDSINTNCIVQSMLMQYCYASVDIRGITMSELENENAIGIEVANNVSVSFVRSVRVNSSRSCIVCSKSDVAVFNCELSNHKYAIYANDSHVRSRNNTGISNSVALASTGGSVFTREGQQPTGTMPYDVYEGSTIVSSYGARIGTLANDVTLYVATTGSDSGGDGTSAKPFKTIQYAINTLPKDLGGFTVTIIVSAGAYPETVLVQSFHNGLFVLRSALGLVLSNDYQINDIICKFDTARIYIYGFNLITSSSHAFFGIDCSDIILQYFTAKQTSGFSAFQFDSCRARIENSIAANKATGVYAYNSIISSATWNNQSLNNAVGIIAGASSTVYLLASQPAGTVPFVTGGGVFFQPNGTQISSLITSGLSCTWGTIKNGGYVRHGNYVGTAMVTVQIQVTTNMELSAGVTYYIYGFPKPQFSIAASCSHPGRVSDYI